MADHTCHTWGLDLGFCKSHNPGGQYQRQPVQPAELVETEVLLDGGGYWQF